MAGRKLFVGSLPHSIQDAQLRAEFGKYGQLEDVFVKPGCEPTRQWAFVTYLSADDALRAKEATDRILQFPGVDRPCDVMVAKHQGMFGQDPVQGGSPDPYNGGGGYGGGYDAAEAGAPKKVFVGSLPETITDIELRAEFSKYGQVLDLFLNTKPVEVGRQWAFITFANTEQAQNAKVNADRILVFPGADKPCEVTLARHQGMFGKEPIASDGMGQPAAGYGGTPVYAVPVQGPRKIFVGSLPPDVNDAVLTAEFSKYGQVVDIHMNNKPCEPGRNWAFITFASSEQAAYAKDSTDRVLMFPGSDRACEVMFSKNQGKFGQEPLNSAPIQTITGPTYMQQPAMVVTHGQPPPPPTPPPQHLTPWRMYKTAAGLPYYHNHTTGVTQWECPPDLQVPGQSSAYVAQSAPTHVRYSPY